MKIIGFSSNPDFKENNVDYTKINDNKMDSSVTKLFKYVFRSVFLNRYIAEQVQMCRVKMYKYCGHCLQKLISIWYNFYDE